jgi:nitrite reductase/ring-hydroxylating ferredoxin subunit/uncharacterized membrane protein
MSALREIVRRLERFEALDRIARPVAGSIAGVVRPRVVRNLLSGVYLGHPLHPMATDVPIGAWGMAGLLDAIGARAAEPAADLLVTVGTVAAVPTAASGLHDWSDTAGPARRVGLVHATANTVALSLYLASLLARGRGSRRAGKMLGFSGLGVLLVGGYLGGHLSYVKGVNVNRTAWEEGPREWVPTLADTELADGDHRRVDVEGVPVVLYRTAGRVHALAATCSHMGGPLDEGTIDDGCVSCPWHGSMFRFSDGSVVRGPASVPQPRYETQARAGLIEVRVSP